MVKYVKSKKKERNPLKINVSIHTDENPLLSGKVLDIEGFDAKILISDLTGDRYICKDGEFIKFIYNREDKI